MRDSIRVRLLRAFGLIRSTEIVVNRNDLVLPAGSTTVVEGTKVTIDLTQPLGRIIVHDMSNLRLTGKAPMIFEIGK